MRILHLAKYYWPHSGGMERVVQDLAEGAATLGHDVDVVAYESGGRRDGRRQHSRVTRVFSLGAVGSQEIAPGYLAAARRAADIIHLHHPHTLADFAALTRGKRIPLVITQHADGNHRGFRRLLARTALGRASASMAEPPGKGGSRCAGRPAAHIAAMRNISPKTRDLRAP